jgi:hypothetical protein
MQPVTAPGVERVPLSPSQSFRINVARADLDRARGLELAEASVTELMLTAAELISSLGEVLRLIDELAEGRP